MSTDFQRAVRPFQHLQNQQGGFVISILLSLLIIMVSVYVLIPDGNSSTRLSRQQEFDANIIKAQYDLLSYLNNPLSWRKTFQDTVKNPNLNSCLTVSTYNCPNVVSPLIINDSSGNSYYNSSAGSPQGIDLNGVICASYGAFPCQLRYNLTWQPQCPPSGACIQPPIVITFTLSSTATVFLTVLINPSRFNYQMRIN